MSRTYVYMVEGVPTQISYHNIKKRHPGTSFPIVSSVPDGFLEDIGYSDLVVDEPPVPGPTQKVVYPAPTLEGGVWYQRSLLVPKTAPELEAMKPDLILRAEKDGEKKAREGYVHTNGKRYDSSDLGLFRVTRALVRFSRKPQAVIKWKCEDAVTGDRVVHNMNATNMNSLADALDTHLDQVQEAVENTIAKIEAGDFSATFESEYDAIVNPGV